MEHVEFFHRDHFQYRYHRKMAGATLAHFIDFFWETDFDPLYDLHPDGFSDALFPNVGYTYLINLGTPFVMQLEHEKHEVRSDAYLPRHKNMVCHHRRGNKIFGIKFKVSPAIFERKINFSEYREYLYPLAYLIDRKVIEQIKTASNFEERVGIITEYYNRIVEKYAGTLLPVQIVTGILSRFEKEPVFDTGIEHLALQHNISSRTLQRYFEATTSISSKKALQIMRIRKALESLVLDKDQFDCRLFGYYDYSHFYKHLKSFVSVKTISIIKPHLRLLKGV